MKYEYKYNMYYIIFPVKHIKFETMYNFFFFLRIVTVENIVK
jgi:hypothetical protein